MSVTVGVECSCGRSDPLPLEVLYICQTCERIACPFCVTKAVDIYFCAGNCAHSFDSMLVSDALNQRNRCALCFECPICFHTLAVTARTTQYFLSCSHCKWNSLACGLVADDASPLLMTALSRTKDHPAAQMASATVRLLWQWRERLQVDRGRTKLFTGSRLPAAPAFETELATIAATFAPAQPASALPWPTDPLAIAAGPAAAPSSASSAAGAAGASGPSGGGAAAPASLDGISTLSQRLHDVVGQSPLRSGLQVRPRPLNVRCSRACERCGRAVAQLETQPASAGVRRARVARAALPRITVLGRVPGRVHLLLTSPVAVPARFHAVGCDGLSGDVRGELGPWDETDDVPVGADVRRPGPADAEPAVVWAGGHRAVLAMRAGPVGGRLQMHCEYTSEQGKEERFDYTVVIRWAGQ